MKNNTYRPPAGPSASPEFGHGSPLWRLHPVMMALCLAGVTCTQVQAKEYFNPAFLDDVNGGSAVDMSAFESAGVVPEGDYLVDVYMNRTQVFTRTMHFAKTDKGDVLPVLTPAQLKTAGVATGKLDSLKNMPPDAKIADLRTVIPDATVTFDMSKLRLDLTVPQADMLVQSDGTVDPSLWDEGVPGMVLGYMGSANRSKSDGPGGTRTDSLFGSVNGGMNLGAWRLRSGFSYNQTTSDGQGYHYDTRSSNFSNTYVQRDIAPLRAEMAVGELSSGSDVFAESIPFRGVQLTSEDAMQPLSQRGFHTVISGVANSTAKVSVRQNGYLIYETTVSPGPFRLTDINVASGELETTVTEADGTKHVSSQYISTIGNMKAQGAVDWAVTAGKYHGGDTFQGSRDPMFAMTTARVGLPGAMTLYSGLLVSQNYQSAVTGLALSLGVIGALSLDATLARAKVNTFGHAGEDGEPAGDDSHNQRTNGQALRMQFARSLESTGTSLSLSGTRYSNRYLSFRDTATAGYALSDNQAPWLRERQRSNWQANLSQTLGTLGSVFLNFSRSDYWSSPDVTKSVGAGFNSSIMGVNYGVNYNESRTQSHAGSSSWPVDRQVSLNVNVPFSVFSPQWQSVRDIYATYNMQHDNRGRTTQTAGMSGTLLNNKLSWNASGNHDNQGGGNSGNLGAGWSGDRVSTSMNYGRGPDTQSFGAFVNGGVVIHPHGITLARSASPDSAIALIEAPGADGVSVGGTATDSRGYAVSSYLSPYQRNTVSLDTTTLPDGVDIPQSSVVVYPTKGAIVEAKFKTRVGRQAMLTLNFQGKPVPFGAMVSLPTDDDMSSAIVGDTGMVYLTGAPQAGTLQVRWGNEAGQQCQVNYDLGPLPTISKDDPNATAMSIVQKTLTCQPVSATAQTKPADDKPAGGDSAGTADATGGMPGVPSLTAGKP